MSLPSWFASSTHFWLGQTCLLFELLQFTSHETTAEGDSEVKLMQNVTTRVVTNTRYNGHIHHTVSCDGHATYFGCQSFRIQFKMLLKALNGLGPEYLTCLPSPLWIYLYFHVLSRGQLACASSIRGTEGLLGGIVSLWNFFTWDVCLSFVWKCMNNNFQRISTYCKKGFLLRRSRITWQISIRIAVKISYINFIGLSNRYGK